MEEGMVNKKITMNDIPQGNENQAMVPVNWKIKKTKQLSVFKFVFTK